MLTSLAACQFRWAEKVANDLNRAHPGAPLSPGDELGLVILGLCLSVVLCGWISAIASFGVGAFTSKTSIIGLAGFGVANGLGTVFSCSADLITRNLGVNSFVYLNAVLGLEWLALFTEIEVSHAVLLTIGIALIVAVCALIKTRAVTRRPATTNPPR